MRLTLLLDMAADGFGDRVLVGRRSAGITAAELARRSHSGAALLRERAADALVYLDVNGPAFPVALFAAARAGVPLVPVNYRLGQQQLDALLARHPKAVGVAAPGALAHFERAGIEAMTADAWLEHTRADRGEVSEAPADDESPVAVVIYTSGTTSEPKGVLLRHENLVSYVLGSVEFAAAAETEAALVSVPPYHIAAVANVITNLYAGRRTLVLEAFTPGEWLRTVREEEVSSAMVVPTMLARIIDSAEDRSVPSLRSLSYGGAPMPAALIERALREWTRVDFVNAYGLTETSSTVALLGPADHRAAVASDDPAVRTRLSSVGRPLPGIELEIRGPGGEVLGAGQAGRICVRGGQVSAEYAGLGRAVDDRGFFDTRDDGYLDADGYLFISGRADDTIIRGAENIAPAEIEDVLLRHPAVLDAVVFGVPDPEWGQRIEAAVVARPEASVDPAELRSFTLRALRSSKTPDRFWLLDALPRTETGKLLRRMVPSLIAQNARDEPCALLIPLKAGALTVAVPADLHGLSSEDVLAIQGVIVKYGFLIDDREFGRLGEVFTEDAVVDYRPGGAGPFAGLAEIDRAMRTLQHPVQHMLVSHIIDSVSGDEVVTRTKALIPLHDGGIADIAYRDVLVRTPAGWRIKDKSIRSYR